MYEQDITLCFNGTKKQMGGYIKKRFTLDNGAPKREGNFSTLVGSNGNIAYLIYLEHFHWEIKDYGLLAHEVMHCVYRVLDDLGFLISDSSIEAYCYYYQRIFQECICGIKEKLKK